MHGQEYSKQQKLRSRYRYTSQTDCLKIHVINQKIDRRLRIKEKDP